VAYGRARRVDNVIREQLYQVAEKSSGNHALKLTNVWHAYPKWHAERFPQHMIFTTAPIFLNFFSTPSIPTL